MEIRELLISDYDEVLGLWQNCPGICLHSDVDSKHWISIYLQRNPGLSFVALKNRKIIGAVLCGHDGRRGYINHLAVAENWRCRGIGTALVERVIDRLSCIGIRKCNGLMLADNAIALEFYRKNGWAEGIDLKIISKSIML